MSYFHGQVGVSFGVGTTINTVNGLFQSREHNFTANSEEIKDGGETTVSKVYWDFKETATFVYVSFQPGNYPGGDAPITIPSLGMFVIVVDPKYNLIVDGSTQFTINGNWLVEDIHIANSNTTSVRVTLKLSRYPYISVVANPILSLP